MKNLSLQTDGMEALMQAIRRPTIDTTRFRTTARRIIDAVRTEGDSALRRMTQEFDGVDLASLRVSAAEIAAADAALDSPLREAIRSSIANVTAFHKADRRMYQTVETTPGVQCWRIIRPIDTVGLYIPAGTAPLLSTAIMLGVPAKMAGVPRIIICSPPQKDGRIASQILAACSMLGLSEIYAVGGAQAIAAMAYGTQTIPKVDKICGPGNAYVTAAKAEVSLDPDGAAIDMLAGPSELLVIADEKAKPAFVAADLLSQAEHDRNAQVILVATSAAIIDAIQAEVAGQIQSLPRRTIAEAALEQSVSILVSDLSQAAEVANRYAPEHLSIQTADPVSVLSLIRNAGSIFLGSYAPEAVGDYCSGTNHVLPTLGQARIGSGISLQTFQKAPSVQMLSRAGLAAVSGSTAVLARAEGLEAHARAAEIRDVD